MRSTKTYTHTALGRLVLLILLALFVLFSSRQGWLAPLEDGVAAVVVPVQKALAGGSRAVAATLASLRETRNLRAENAALQRTVDELVREVVRLRAAELENRTLREQLGYVQTQVEWTFLPAQVIGRDPTGVLDYVLIDRGRRGGVQEGMVVVTPRGLVGRVTAAGAQWAKVLLITSPSSAVSTAVQGGARQAYGVAYGTPAGAIQMRYILQTEQVRLRDIVVTSGIGGGFPKDLIVGQVIHVERSDVAMFQTADLEPFVDLAHLEQVLVIGNFVPQPLEERIYRESVP